MIATEWHTTELTAACQRAVQLRLEGKAIGEVPGAMYKGSLFGECARLIHERNAWNVEKLGTLMLEAASRLDTQIDEEGRRKTKAVAKNINDLDAEVCRWVRLYIERFADYFAASKFLACEVPVRMTIDVDGEPVEFASHLDLLYRDPSGYLCVDDWKTGEESPSPEYLLRNMQLGMYAVAVAEGSVMLGGEWMELGEVPLVTWVHVRNLIPYSRKTTAKDDTGEQREFVAGEARPVRAIRRDVPVRNPSAVLAEFATRVRMRRAGLFPTNPDPVGCRICECRRACASWTDEEVSDGE